MKLKLLLTSLALMVLISLQAQTQKALTVDEILSKYFAATGGLDKWKALKSRTAVGKAMFGPGQEFPMTVYEMAPNKQKTVVNVQGTELMLNVYDGKDAWMLNPLQGGKDPVKLDDENAKDIKDEEFEDDFIDYQKKGHEVTLEGTEEIDGVKCYKIKLVKNKNNPKDDSTEIHYFDAENFVPIVVVSYIKSGPMKGTEIKNYLSDYQDIDGLMFPFSMEQKVNGQPGPKITLEKITLNDVKDESIFAFPKK
jgi:outer membrane lipoprotein-sorting protein